MVKIENGLRGHPSFTSPYIGITGFKTEAEIAFASESLNSKRRVYSMYKLEFGFISSSKHLQDPSFSDSKSPSLKDLEALVKKVPKDALPMVHYYTENKQALAEELTRLFGNGLYEHCKAVQLNVKWPRLQDLEKIGERFPDMNIVLWLPQDDEREIVRRAPAYRDLVTHLLIDKSGGKGKPLDAKRAAKIMQKLGSKMSLVWPGVAGGLSAETIPMALPVINGFCAGRQYSIDAEGALRTQDGTALDPKKVRAYLRAAVQHL